MTASGIKAEELISEMKTAWQAEDFGKAYGALEKYYGFDIRKEPEEMIYQLEDQAEIIKMLLYSPGKNGFSTIFSDKYVGDEVITYVRKGYVEPEKIMDLIQKVCGEDQLFKKHRYGRMNRDEFESLAASLKAGWRDDAPTMIFVKWNGSVEIFEGRHRLRAAAHARIKALVEFRYFGASEERGIYF